jgi:hypothetical protein
MLPSLQGYPELRKCSVPVAGHPPPARHGPWMARSNRRRIRLSLTGEAAYLQTDDDEKPAIVAEFPPDPP